jgi:hypothetical protein
MEERMSDFGRLQELARAAGVQVSPPSVVDVPQATGTGVVGSTLNCTMGNWNGEPTSYAYQWNGTGQPSDAADYTVAADDVGQSLSCVVTATNTVGSTAAPPSNAITAAATAAARSAPQDAHADARSRAESGESRQRK